jgi:uncharacterized protein YdhG (YjbR/CyaY superfamily)
MIEPTSVDDYLAALPEASRIALENLRAAIRAAAPGATETISYGMPAFKDHCSLFPGSKAVIEAYKDELGPRATGKGTIQFRADRPLLSQLVAKIVRARLEENAARRRR